MANLFLVSFLVVFTVVNSRPQANTDPIEDIDIDLILSNNRLVNNYLVCIKTGQKCPANGQRIRNLVLDALKTRCANCTEIQRSRALKILEWAIENRVNDFLEIENLYDPQHNLRKDYASELKARNIVLPPIPQ